MYLPLSSFLFNQQKQFTVFTFGTHFSLAFLCLLQKINNIFKNQSRMLCIQTFEICQTLSRLGYLFTTNLTHIKTLNISTPSTDIMPKPNNHQLLN